MLELKKVTKIYQTGSFKQKALDDVSISFRKNEFASILGPSGSGKTTLLNIIGGLDKYTSGDLIINGVSTKKYKDRNWDSYRNHRVGFVFQSYNLISHQSILANVELALTLSGVSKKERKLRAKKALEDVGLEKHIHKKPSELSGGQMQRVAIARSLVNNPDILLADEPTGALDSETSKQVMDILKDIAKDRLVIMVTHNPELAEEYSSRIVKLKDGKVISDTNPYKNKESKDNEDNKSGKTSMSFFTALSLSLNNLMTKKGRTLLTAFAGSIGIIGIALILSLSSGVNKYITDVQKDTMLSYPITIEEEAMDLSAFLEQGKSFGKQEDNRKHAKDAIYLNSSTIELASKMTTTLYSNNLKDFKEYLDDKKNEIHKYIGENGIHYSYATKFKVFNYDADGKLVNSDGSTFESKIENSSNLSYLSTYSTPFTTNIFTEIMPDVSGDNISAAIKEEYELVTGAYPKEYNEVLFVLPKSSEVNITDIYYLGLLPSKEYKDILDKIDKNEEIKIDKEKISYDDILNTTFKLLTASDFYVKNKNGNYESIIDDDKKTEDLVKKEGIELKVVGVLRQKEDSKNDLINGTIGYTKELTNFIIDRTNNSKVVKAQEDNKDVNIMNGLKYNVSSDNEKVKEAKKYLSNLKVSDKANMALMMVGSSNPMIGAMSESQLASLLDNYLKNPDKKAMIEYYDNYLSPGTYDKVMASLGKVDLSKPSRISIYADTFEAKDGVIESINSYNKKAEEEDKITYTDYVGLLMSSVTTIINAITYVLIAFVSISLVVSSIMIAIITYISVLERTKEIGILRAIGASKKDVTRVFKAETFIEGLIAGCMGILVTILLNIPINKIIYKLTDINGISRLPLMGAIILIIISVFLTVIAGLVPSKMAAKKDPVEALRTE